MGVYEKQTIKLESNNILLSRNRKVNCEKKNQHVFNGLFLYIYISN